MPIETALWIYVLVLAFLCGACAGSFVNCAADRYAAKQSIFRGRSHCPVCGHTLGILDLFPIVSYIFLRGKCRHCGAKIPVRCLITELCGGLLFLTAAMRFGVSFQTLEYCLLFAALFAVALIDFDTMEIPDGIHLFGIFVFILCRVVDDGDALSHTKSYLLRTLSHYRAPAEGRLDYNENIFLFQNLEDLLDLISQSFSKLQKKLLLKDNIE